ncbi:fused (3R)-hydroxyacyl-ACP dehydratase subunits HadA/HadB [Nocardia rhizosphaerihabitans]|uniref:(R)-hydratase n=1 Tax=Nocardia rhizosphaerihabitans TaxID=1691570 RepID=A0ABQ2KXQ7_9NOCA|nr:fused (3R)-hydroxyacyl-ACP dehydratase subunits HadA/HadB [Nocardia rhizosphaerihabitans]GGN95798.1 (R)-hydratase [Nocardia rhizosphaerihabitans]
MTTAVDTPALASRVGHYLPYDDIYVVGREKIREYAGAVQDFHPAHWDEAAATALGYTGLVAPMTFVSIPAANVNQRLFETAVIGYDMFVQTEQVFEQHRPIVAGDRLITDAELSSVRRIAGKDLITVTNTFADESGERVHTMHTTVVGITSDEVDPALTDAVQGSMMYGVNVFGRDGADDYLPEPLRPRIEVPIARPERASATARSFDDLVVGEELSLRKTHLSRGDLVNYAGVSGDNNPIHWDANIARLAGLPDVIAHGMLSIGLGAGFVSDWTGDPGAATRYGVRLSQTAVVDATVGGGIEFTGKVKSLGPEARSAVIAISAKSGGRKIFGLATTNVTFR